MRLWTSGQITPTKVEEQHPGSEFKMIYIILLSVLYISVVSRLHVKMLRYAADVPKIRRQPADRAVFPLPLLNADPAFLAKYVEQLGDFLPARCCTWNN